MGASLMHDGLDNIGKESETAVTRRSVNADSFRRLTALLKKPAVVPHTIVVAPMVQPSAPEVAVALQLPEVPPPLVARPAPVEPDLPPVEDLQPVQELPQAAEAEAPLAAPEFGLESVLEELPVEEPSQMSVAEPEVPEPAAWPDFPPTEDMPPVQEPAQVSDAEVRLASADFGIESAIEESHAEEPSPLPVAEYEVAEPAEVTDSAPFAAEMAEPAAPIVLAMQELATEPNPSEALARRARQRAADTFSLTPDLVQQTRAEPQIQQTPQQEAESAELAQSLLDMMAASASGGQPQERALAADTLLRLLPRLPARTRTTLAQRLSMMDAPPPFLVAKLLAENDLAICGPLLEDCMHISDDDLLALVASRNADKRRLIARRRRISRPVTEALAASGDISTMLTLVRNQGAEIGQEGFALLAESAVNNSDLLPPLCTRQDLPVHFAFELFWHAPAQLRRYLLSRFLTDSENLTKILRITMGAHGEDQGPTADLDLEALGAALLRFMADDASIAERDQVMSTLAAAAKVKPATIERILQDDQGEPLMALMKVLGVPRSMLEAEMHQFTSSAHHLIDPARNLSEVQAVFDQLSFTKARILLTYWDWATTKSGPYAVAN